MSSGATDGTGGSISPSVSVTYGCGILGVYRSPQGERCEGRDSSQVPRHRGALRLRCDVADPVDQAGAPPRDLQQLPPVLHGPPEAHRYGRPRRTLYQALRCADVREPQGRPEGTEGREEAGGCCKITLTPGS